jgi:hypothetical protein
MLKGRKGEKAYRIIKKRQPETLRSRRVLHKLHIHKTETNKKPNLATYILLKKNSIQTGDPR